MKRVLKRLIELVIFSLVSIIMLSGNVSVQNNSIPAKIDNRLELRIESGVQLPVIELISNGSEEYTYCSSESLVSDTESSESKVAYLTFDDGPSANNTPRILDILNEYKIKATFFVNGYGKKDIYKRIVDEGHVIGNHTFSHNYKTVYSSVSGFKKDIEKLSDYLEEITGKRPDVFRFPGGSNNTVSRKYGGNKIMKTLCGVVSNDMGFQYFDWNVSSEDATTYRAKKDFIVRSTLKYAKYAKRAIVLMHDAAAKTTTVEALPEIIDGLAGLGFEFDVLTQNTPSIQFKVL